MNIFYLAPLQGFTEHFFRSAYHSVFGNIDKFFTPFFSREGVHAKRGAGKRELHFFNSIDYKLVPQLLVNTTDELDYWMNALNGFRFDEINLNFGCPYPMLVKRGLGAGILQKPDSIQHLLSHYYSKYPQKLSIKLRIGIKNENEIDCLIEILNSFPLYEVTIHPRLASQLYAGEIFYEKFGDIAKQLHHSIVYNGDIINSDSWLDIRSKFTSIHKFMIGRGILSNLFLLDEMKNIQQTTAIKQEKFHQFHETLQRNYQLYYSTENEILQMLKPYWVYLKHHFNQPEKAFKQIKKTSDYKNYLHTVQVLVNNSLI